jgi:hypothetical protein
MKTLPAIVWTDDEPAGLVVRNKFRADGHQSIVRNAAMFATADVEPASRLVFLNASNRDAIIAAYRQDHVRAAYGDIEVVDIPMNDYRQAETIPTLQSIAPPEAPKEPDALDEQIANMSDDDLRTFIFGTTGQKPHHRAGRDKLVAMLRAHNAGAPPPAAEPETDEAASSETGPENSTENEASLGLSGNEMKFD